MRGRPFLRAFLFLSIPLLPTVARAEAWPRETGQLYAYFGATTFSSSTIYDVAGNKGPFPGRSFKESGDNSYLELGLSERFTFVGTIPRRKVKAEGLFNDFTSQGLADLDVRLRYSIPIREGLFAAVEGGAFVPLGYDRQDFPELGSGHTDALVNGSLGLSLPFLPQGFLNADVGYRFRGGEIANEIPYALKVGAFPHPRVGVFLFARGWKSTADFSRVAETAGFLVSDSERLSAGGELYLKVSRHFDVNGAWSHVVAGRNVLAGDTFMLGVAFHAKLF
ncbi:MAG: hypothetical protein ABIT01_05170 [Thermoanaerobaculia bacterium]